MRCLYCGKELALLKRLTGGGEFCSDAHKHSYQEEYNRLALSRLLQAQKKGQQGQQSSNAPAENAAPPARVAVAVEEPSPEPEPVQAVTEEAAIQAEPEADLDRMATEESAAEVSETGEEADEEAPISTEPEPLETAEFLFESPALAALPEQTPYQESWLELSMGPAVSDWQLEQGAVFNLSPADLVALDLPPRASNVEDAAHPLEASPQAWAGAAPEPALATTVNSHQAATTNRLPVRGAIALEITPSSLAPAADHTFVQALSFANDVVIEDSELLELWSTPIDFQADDSDVVVLAGSHNNGTALAVTQRAPEAAEDASPRASLEALSRLHQELREQELARSQPMEAAPAEEEVEDVIEAVPVEVIAPPAPVADETPEATAETAEAAAEEIDSPQEASKPRYATELFEIPIRTFAPGKAALAGGQAYPNQTAPLLPELKSLPLRPKVAVATGYGASPTPATRAVRTPAPAKPVSGAKPAARLAQPRQPTLPAKPASSGAPKTSEPRTPTPVKAVSPKTEAPKTAAKIPVAQPTAAQEAPPAEKTPAEKTQVEKAVAEKEPAEKAPTAKPAPVPELAKAVTESKKDVVPSDATVPSFNLAQPGNNSWLGSLKVKLGIAILLLSIAGIYFLGWGGKSHKPAGSNAAILTDGSGPSIIMGEGGWVEGWGGDPNGLRVGRQITIYRPSLKLSDYRLEFQASMDVRSIGWVFRAADPADYYAMKLMTVSNGLSPKVALFKYLVSNGKQTQVGRVPIDLAVQPDTVFDIRVDVRGPQFTTFIQGQQVDSWTDDQLKVGGAGFLNEREERGKVKTVSIRYLSGASK